MIFGNFYRRILNHVNNNSAHAFSILYYRNEKLFSDFDTLNCTFIGNTASKGLKVPLTQWLQLLAVTWNVSTCTRVIYRSISCHDVSIARPFVLCQVPSDWYLSMSLLASNKLEPTDKATVHAWYCDMLIRDRLAPCCCFLCLAHSLLGWSCHPHFWLPSPSSP